MPIDFSCPQCSRVLRVGDEHAGRQAKCPDCSTVMIVPAVAAPAPVQPPSQHNPLGGNYGFGAPESPISNAGGIPPRPPARPKPRSAGVSGRGRSRRRAQPTVANAGDIISRAWKLTFDHFGLLFGAALMVMFVSILFGAVQYGVNQMDPANQGNWQRPAEQTQTIVGGFVQLIGSIITMFLSIGLVRICLQLGRKGTAEFATLFTGGECFMSLLGASFLVGIAFVGTTLFCLFFGFLGAVFLFLIMFVLFFWPYYYLIIDGKESAMNSFSTGFELARINVHNTLLMGLVSFMLAIAGALALGVSAYSS